MLGILAQSFMTATRHADRGLPVTHGGPTTRDALPRLTVIKADLPVSPNAVCTDVSGSDVGTPIRGRLRFWLSRYVGLPVADQRC